MPDALTKVCSVSALLLSNGNVPPLMSRQSARRRKTGASIAELSKLYQERSDKLRKADAVEMKMEAFRWQIEEQYDFTISLL